jgi:hypothetical protein
MCPKSHVKTHIDGKKLIATPLGSLMELKFCYSDAGLLFLEGLTNQMKLAPQIRTVNKSRGAGIGVRETSYKLKSAPSFPSPLNRDTLALSKPS